MKMKKVASVLLVGFMIFSAIGCGKNDADSAAGENEMSICTIVKAEEPILDWDPAISYCGDEHTFINMYETLIYYDANTDEYKPQLATDYSSSEDGLVWTFKIREGVKFHDGTVCDAEAVKFSLDRNKGMQQGAAYIWDPVEEIIVKDEYTVEFHLSSPCNMAEVVSCQFCAFIYSPTAVGEDWDKGSEWFYEGNECGTGPYMLQSWTAGDSIVLTRFDEYWGGWEGEHFDKAVIRTVSEAATRRQMIESGEADVAVQIGAKNCEAIEEKEGLYTVIAEGSSNNTPVWFSVEKDLLKDVNVRKALAYAFPYEDVVNNVMYGKYAELPKDVLSPAAGHGATDSQPYTYDLEKAKEYLTAAGYPDGGLSFNITIASYHEETKSILELWQSELSKLNIQLNIEPIAENTLFSRSKGDLAQQQDILVQEQSIDLISAYSAYASGAATGASWNFANYSDPWVDENLKKVNELAATDMEASDKLMQEVGAKVAEDCMAINLFDRNYTFTMRDDFKGFEHNTAYICGIFIYDCYREA